MLMEQTLQTLNALRLPGMASAFAEQQTSAATMDLPFDERFAMLVDRKHAWRENRRVTRLLREAKLKSSQACIEDVRYGGGRKLDKTLMASWAVANGFAPTKPDPDRGDRLRQDLAGVCAGKRRLSAGAVGGLCAHAPVLRGIAHRPWRRQLRQASVQFRQRRIC